MRCTGLTCIRLEAQASTISVAHNLCSLATCTYQSSLGVHMSAHQNLCVQLPLHKGRNLPPALILIHKPNYSCPVRQCLANGFEYVVPGQCVFTCPPPCDSLLAPVTAPSHLTPVRARSFVYGGCVPCQIIIHLPDCHSLARSPFTCQTAIHLPDHRSLARSLFTSQITIHLPDHHSLARSPFTCYPADSFPGMMWCSQPARACWVPAG